MAVNTVCLTGPNTVSLASANAVNLTCPGEVTPPPSAEDDHTSRPGGGNQPSQATLDYWDRERKRLEHERVLRREEDELIILV